MLKLPTHLASMIYFLNKVYSKLIYQILLFIYVDPCDPTISKFQIDLYSDVISHNRHHHTIICSSTLIVQIKTKFNDETCNGDDLKKVSGNK